MIWHHVGALFFAFTSFFGGFFGSFGNHGNPVYAYGGLSVDWPTPVDKVFVVANMLPGDTVEKTVKVTNGAPNARAVAVWGEETSSHTIFPDALQLVITENGTPVYTGSLTKFFTDSDTPAGVSLSTIASHATKQYKFRVLFPEGSDNEYQRLQVVFSLTFGIAARIPDSCKHMRFHGRPIFGTHGNDTLYGTEGDDLIFGFEGNDKIYGRGGNDCIVGGDGDDDMHGGDGDDSICSDNDDEGPHRGRDYNDGGRGRDYCDGRNRRACER